MKAINRVVIWQPEAPLAIPIEDLSYLRYLAQGIIINIWPKDRVKNL